jgi:hypothetical protein
MDQLIAQMKPKQEKGQVVSPGGALVDPSGKVMYQAPFKPEADYGRLPKPPKDYRVNKEGDGYEVIPGSGTETKMKAEVSKAKGAAKTVARILESEIENINKLIGSDPNKITPHKGLASATGPIESRLPTLRGSTANAEALMESLRSKASISALQDIRGSSQSIGQITEREWPRLENLKATLQAAQTLEQYTQALSEYRAYLLRVKRETESTAAEVESGGMDAPASMGGAARPDPLGIR